MRDRVGARGREGREGDPPLPNSGAPSVGISPLPFSFHAAAMVM